MEANAAGAARESGGVEKRVGAGGIEIVMDDVGFISPVTGRQEAVGGPRFAAQKVANESLAISGVGEGLANFSMRENGIVTIECDVVDGRSRGFRDDKMRSRARATTVSGGSEFNSRSPV